MTNEAQKQDIQQAAAAQVANLDSYRQARLKQSTNKAVNVAATMLAAMCVAAGDVAETVDDRYLSESEAHMINVMVTYTAAVFTTTHGRVERDVLRTFRVYEIEALKVYQLQDVVNFLAAWRD